MGQEGGVRAGRLGRLLVCRQRRRDVVCRCHRQRDLVAPMHGEEGAMGTEFLPFAQQEIPSRRRFVRPTQHPEKLAFLQANRAVSQEIMK